MRPTWTAQNRGIRDLAKKGILLGFAIVAALLASEGLARLFVKFVRPNVMILDEDLGWKHRANARRIFENEGHFATVETNDLGLRGPLYRGPSQGRRVLILGDSFSDGLEVSNDELFSTVLGRLRPDLEVVNAGVGGYGTVQELLLLRRLELVVRPDLCVLMVYVNDLTDNVMPFYEGIGPQPYVDTAGRLRNIDWVPFEALLLPLPGARFLHKHSVVSYLVRNRIWLPVRNFELNTYIQGWRGAVPMETKWALLERLIGTVAQGRKLVVVALPTKEDVATNNTDFSIRLERLARRVGVKFIGLQPALQVQHFFMRDIHWNVAGHQAVASYLSLALAPRSIN